MTKKLDVTVLIATKNEGANLQRCLGALDRFKRVAIIDSSSEDGTRDIAQKHGAEIVDFVHRGGYPKKRQWALENLDFSTSWILLLDADEVMTSELEAEIEAAIGSNSATAYAITKGFHFLGRKFRFGGFSHAAVLLFRVGTARFERILDNPPDSLDMEVHERLIVSGTIEQLVSPLIHEDFKGLDSYIDKHNRYSAWEAEVRHRIIKGEVAEGDAIRPSLFGDIQQRRRALKKIAMRLPFEAHAWFIYHYLLRFGFLEGRRGLIACQLRKQYIECVRAKMYQKAILAE